MKVHHIHHHLTYILFFYFLTLFLLKYCQYVSPYVQIHIALRQQLGHKQSEILQINSALHKKIIYYVILFKKKNQ